MNRDYKLYINVTQFKNLKFCFSPNALEGVQYFSPQFFSHTQRVSGRDAGCDRIGACSDNGAGLKASRDCGSLGACSRRVASQALLFVSSLLVLRVY